jgi:hypothetical protein
MTNGGNTAADSDFKDRKTGLVVFGVLEIAFGALCALMAPLMLLSRVASSTLAEGAASSVSAGAMVPSLLFYTLLAVWFIWMGIGSIQARRWARALLLVSSWIWLISGLMGLVFMLVFMPDLYEQMARSGQIPRQVVAVMKVAMIVFMTVFYIIIPGALVLFYGSRHTKATCERRDPQVRWTDKCPLPVLAVSLISGCWAACMPLMGFYGWAMPFFGVILTGIAGAGVVLVGSLLLGTVAWGLYRLSVNAWRCAVLLIMAWGVSAGITFSRVSLMEFYEKMQFSARQLEMMKQLSLPQERWMLLSCGLWIVIALAYLLYIRKYFTPAAEQPGVSPIERI